METADTDSTHQYAPADRASDFSAPLKGVVICCTSIADEKRTELKNFAEQMGGAHRFDLTLDVTHLIVGDYDTPKYKYVAKERYDVRPMAAKWIEAIRELWINDQLINMESLEREHTLPTLTSLKFSMTGCDDPTERQAITDLVRANGGQYEGDLTKQITHLISFRTEGPKYKAAQNWGLRIVSIEWLQDSLERGMILDESLYHPTLPLEERGKGAWDREKANKNSLRKRSRDDSVTSLEEGRRKLRRTASTKLSSQNDRIWGDIVGAGMIAQVSRSGQWESSDHEGPHDRDIVNETILGQSASRVPLATTNSKQVAYEGLFSRCRFYLHGFTPTRVKVLQDHLLPHDAEISPTLDDLATSSEKDTPTRLYMIVPHNLPSSQLPTLPQSPLDIETVTEWWVERCLHHKRFLEPAEHCIGRPFSTFPIDGFSKLIICSTAFGGIDLLHLKKAVELLGATYSEELTPQASVLVTNCIVGIRKDKQEHAQKWKISIVNASWLWDSIKAGVTLPFKPYCFRAMKSLASVSTVIGEPPSKTNEQRIDRRREKAATPVLTRNRSTSKSAPGPPRNDLVDHEAVLSDEAVVNHEKRVGNVLLADSPEGMEPSSKTEPLSEISSNSPSKSTVVTDLHKPEEDMSNAITNLLAKTKTASAQPMHIETAEGGRKRGANRILGRVTSSVSTASTSLSRATSVDSTATHGQPVEYPPYTNSERTRSGSNASGQIERFMDGNRNGEKCEDSQPPPTQLQYDDPESKEYKEKVMARMMGEKLDSRKPGRLKEKAITVGDLSEKPKTRRSGRDRGGFR